jgi:hypothetical protein
MREGRHSEAAVMDEGGAGVANHVQALGVGCVSVGMGAVLPSAGADARFHEQSYQRALDFYIHLLAKRAYILFVKHDILG